MENYNSFEEGWTKVIRRWRPQHFTPSLLPPPTQTIALSPLSLTYAQVLQTKPKSPQPPNITMPTHHYTGPPQKSRITTKHVRSPHSPTLLRYPANPHFKEWLERCFRCAKKGHVITECKHPRTTLTPVDQCIQPAPKAGPSQPTPIHNAYLMPKRPRPELTFEEFLGEPEPQQEPQMPLDRLRKMRCYFNRDQLYYQALEKMLRGIVVKPPNSLKTHINLDQIAASIAASAMVAPLQLQVACLSHNCFLTLLPPHLDKRRLLLLSKRHMGPRLFLSLLLTLNGYLHLHPSF